jgi:hypothetical protein
VKHWKAILTASLCVISSLILGQTTPSVPSTIAYQGRITDIDFPLGADGELEMTFLIFDALTGGNLLWSETQPGVAVAGGMYRINLVEAEPIEFSALKGRNAYLEARIFGVALAPRKRIVSAPFALKAEGEVPEGGGNTRTGERGREYFGAGLYAGGRDGGRVLPV